MAARIAYSGGSAAGRTDTGHEQLSADPRRVEIRDVKITIEVDCTPEEARIFCGLPDVKPMQKAVMARLEKQMLEAADAMSPEAMMRTWFTYVPQSPDQAQEMFTRFFSQPFGNLPRKKD